MKIGLDIDDTTVITRKNFNKEIKKYRHKHKMKRYSETKQLSGEDFKKFLKECGENIYKDLKPKKHAAKIISNWKEQGHEIYFITARALEDCDSIEEITKSSFLKYHIPYEQIIFSSKNKAEDAKDLNLDVFVDDQESVLDTFQGTNVYQIRFLENKKNFSKYQKVSTWKELNEIIEKL